MLWELRRLGIPFQLMLSMMKAISDRAQLMLIVMLLQLMMELWVLLVVLKILLQINRSSSAYLPVSPGLFYALSHKH